MGSLIVTNIVSIDGFDRDVDGSPLVLNMDAAFDAYNLERIRAASAVMLGATSYQMFSSFWPYVADAPADPANPALTDTNRAFSRAYNALAKVLVSDHHEPAADNPWHDTTTRLRREDAAAWLAEHREDEGDVVVFGSRTMWNGLLQQGLVDEIHLVVSPCALGAGGPVFDRHTDLRILEARPLDDLTNVLLRCAPTHS